MRKRATIRKRCAECREWFRPPARLVEQQRVCGSACRLKRRAKQARVRRAGEPARHREEERERKRRSREGQRQSGQRGGRPDAGGGAPVGAEGAGCHGPGGARKARKSRREFDDLWDRLLDLSRAGLEREVRKIAREVWSKSRHAAGSGEARHGPGGFCIPWR